MVVIKPFYILVIKEAINKKPKAMARALATAFCHNQKKHIK